MEHDKMSHKRNSRTHLVLGVVLVILGIAVITDLLNIGDWNIRRIVFSWQMLLVALGVIFIAGKDSKPTGFILIAIGGFFLIPEIFQQIPHYWKSLFWPVMLILLGLLIIFHRSSPGFGRNRRSESSEDYLDDVSIFGGGDKVIQSQQFKGGKITNIFGGSKFNLTGAKLAAGTNYLDVIMIFGGSKFIVPEGWDVKLELTSIFGGFSDKRGRSIMVKDPERSLVIKGITLFGGGELISY